MDGHFSITREPDYIHVVINGSGRTHGDKAAEVIWQSIATACKTHNCYKILGEQRLSQPLPLDAAYQHFSIFAKVGIDSRHKIAWVDTCDASRKVVEFISDLVGSRLFVTTKSFKSLEPAREWLASV